jgi:hypothetical protein
MAPDRYRTHVPQIACVTTLKLIYDDGDLRIQALDRGGSLLVELRFLDVLRTGIAPEGVRLRLLPELGTRRGFLRVT